MEFIKIMLMLVLCHLTLIELGIDSVRHQLRHGTEYKPPVFPLVMVCLYAVCAVMFFVRFLLK